MGPLSLEDTRGYISERLRIAGANGDSIFDPDALEMVFRYSGGIPRVINLLCEHALITAFAEEQKPIQAATIQIVAHEFDLDRPLASIAPPLNGERRPSPVLGSLQNLGQLMDRMRRSG